MNKLFKICGVFLGIGLLIIIAGGIIVYSNHEYNSDSINYIIDNILSKGNIDISDIQFGDNVDNLISTKFEKTAEADLDDFSKIDIEVSISELQIKQGEKNKIEIYENNNKKKEAISYKVGNDTLYIKSQKNNELKHTKVVLYLTDKTYEEVRINTNMAEVLIEKNIEADKIKIDLAMGNIETKTLKGKEVFIDLSEAEVVIEDIKAKKIELDAKRGDVEVKNSTSMETKIDSSMGDLDFNGDTEKLELDASMGDTDIKGAIKNAKIKGNMGDIDLIIKGNPNEYEINSNVVMGDYDEIVNITDNNAVKDKEIKASMSLGSLTLKIEE